MVRKIEFFSFHNFRLLFGKGRSLSLFCVEFLSAVLKTIMASVSRFSLRGVTIMMSRAWVLLEPFLSYYIREVWKYMVLVKPNISLVSNHSLHKCVQYCHKVQYKKNFWWLSEKLKLFRFDTIFLAMLVRYKTLNLIEKFLLQ